MSESHKDMSSLSEQVVASKKMVGGRHSKWIPLIWLPYYLFFLLAPVFDHAPLARWVETGVATVFFLIFYFGMFWAKKPTPWFHMAGLVLLGLIFAPSNPGASCFFIYSTAFAPFIAQTEMSALRVMLSIVGLSALETWLSTLSWWPFPRMAWWTLIYSGGFALIIGIGNIFFAQRNRTNYKLRMAQDEIEHLAKVAERERIARDMHDVLGHTLSVIILKSELAGKLIDKEPERAKNEIHDVEQTSRKALAEVRNTIRGYRVQSLCEELKQAKATLETAGVTVKAETEQVKLTPAQESIAALIVREAVTNVVRHAAAQTCLLRLSSLKDRCLIEIQDDGTGSNGAEGNGLRGMRERIVALGGTLERVSGKGTKLTIQFPIGPAKTADIL
jgi:two-component system, NarL family, sensor histidine kinase DesK